MKTMTPEEYQQLAAIAKAAAASQFFQDLKSEAQALMKLLLGYELGLTAAESLMGINIVQGRPEVSARIIASRIKQSQRYDYRVVESTDRKCVLRFFENGEPVGDYEYTWEMAQQAGLTAKQNWKMYPKAMLFNRCLAAGARMYCPDAASGLYVEGEISESVEVQRAIAGAPLAQALPERTQALPEPRQPEEQPAPSQVTPEREERVTHLRRIHQLARQLGYSQEQYREVLQKVGGAPSTKDMTVAQLRAVREYFETAAYQRLGDYNENEEEQDNDEQEQSASLF